MKGMVSSAHDLISQTGKKILSLGGNAIDASIAMALSAGVVLPDMCGLGGDAFLLYYDHQKDKVYAINGSGQIPKNYDLNTPIKKRGMTSVTVPGLVDVLFTIQDKWGTMNFEKLSQDAIGYARNGIHVPSKVERHMHTDLNDLQAYNAGKLYLNQGQPKTKKDLIINLDLANTLEYLNHYGRDGFYQGEITKKIVQYSQNHGGYFTLDDFKDYHCEILEPIQINYRGYTILQTPPVSQGYLHLQEMGILNHLDFNNKATVQKIHAMLEAKKLAFSQREFTYNHVDLGLSDTYTKVLADQIDFNHANNQIGDPYIQNKGHTTSFVVVDQFNNACSFILSIAGTWGSGEIVEGTGILLNNRAGVGLNTILEHPLCILHKQKAVHTLNTWMIFKDHQLKYVGNTPGGDYQVMWNMQLVSHLIDDHMTPKQAVSVPKWRANYDGANHVIEMEEDFGKEIIEALEKLGHSIKVIPKLRASGASQIIEISDDRLEGGSDPRADGTVLDLSSKIENI